MLSYPANALLESESQVRQDVPCLTEASFWAPQHLVESAWLEHAPFAFWLMDVLRPRTVVELGTHAGFSLFAFCQAVNQLRLDTRCHAVDTWRGDPHAGFYGEEVYDKLSATVSEHYGTFCSLIRATFDDTVSQFSDGEIELLHIDGRHRYEDVFHDYTTWFDKLAPQAVVLFHDTCVRERDFGVWRFWGELSQRHPSFEFTHGHGLGVLCPRGVPDALRPLIEASADNAHAVRLAYARLGGAVSSRYLHEPVQQELAAAQSERAQADIEIEQNRKELNDLREQTAVIREESDVLSAQTAVIREESDVLRAQAAENAERLNALEVERAENLLDLESIRSELQSRSKEVDRLRAEADRKEEDQRRMLAQLSATEAELSAIFSSTVWRMASTVARVAGRTPVRARRQLRRVLRALWWIVTPHRLPARLAWLRARGAANQNRLFASFAPPTFLRYVPPSRLQSGAEASANARGKYELTAEAGGYVYVPPRKPDDIDERIQALATRPRFSIVVPLYNTAATLFDAMLSSVDAQWYPNWELILVDDCSPDGEVRKRLAALTDARIKKILLDKNVGISGATNVGLEAATGDYVVFLDHDDELTSDCLFELARCVAERDPDYIYSDEDKIELDGSFGQPFFKPDWSPDALMSTMYTCHVSCVRRALLGRVGLLRSEYDGAQDWDFVLRIVEQAKSIAHIPKVLYHWRVIPASIASSLDAKPKAVDAGRRARVDALKRRGLDADVVPVPQLPGHFRVRYQVQGNPLISIIIPSKNNGAVLQRCVDTILGKSSYARYEVIVLDNGSTDPETLSRLDALKRESKVKVVRHDHPFNFSEINNVGVAASSGSLLLFLNDDTEVLSADWLQRLAGYAQLEHVGAVGAKLLYPGGQNIQHAGVVNLADGPVHAFLLKDADYAGYFGRNLLEFDWIAVTGACLMVSREKFERVGGFDESFPVAYNDVDLCFRLIKDGLYNVVCPDVQLIHHESLTRGLDDVSEKKRKRLAADKQRLYAMHPDLFMYDPFHNPNLAANDLHFAVPSAVARPQAWRGGAGRMERISHKAKQVAHYYRRNGFRPTLQIVASRLMRLR